MNSSTTEPQDKPQQTKPQQDKQVKGALAGVRVIDFTQMMLGPWGTQFLGDLGADVIKVERPKVGEWERSLPAMGQLLGSDSPFFLAMNRNKKSLTVNLKDPEGKRIICELVSKADVVTENFRPGVMDKLGLGYEALKEINPGLIYVAGSGYGQSGPYATKPGQDLLVQALSGLAAASGRARDFPTPLATSVVDAATALSLAFATMVGLFHKARSGEGQRIDVSLFNTAIALQCQELVAYMNMDLGWTRSESGVGAPWLAAPFGIYATADGYIAIAMNSLSTLAELVNLPELAAYDTPARAYEERDTVKTLLQRELVSRGSQAWLEHFATKDIWCAAVQDFEALLKDPQVAHNELIQSVQHESGEIKVIAMPITFSKTPGEIRLNPPKVGEHTDELLNELGYDAARIESLRSSGVI